MDYFDYNSIPDRNITEGLLELHKCIFGASDELIIQMQGKDDLLINIAMDSGRVVAYKIGYSLCRGKFYSWLGGVDPAYRNLGIASTLMEKQHTYLKANGYKVVQTKTKNKWRSMLILNIKSGFNIIGTYTDDKGEPKIILEKRLND